MARGSLDDAPSAVVYGAVQSRDIEVRRGENLRGEPASAALYFRRRPGRARSQYGQIMRWWPARSSWRKRDLL